MHLLLLSLLLLGLLCAAWAVIDHRRGNQTPIVQASGDCSTCTTDNPQCEQACMMEAATKPVEYFDDEELDRYGDREANDYTPDEVAEFEEVMLTMRPDEVQAWLRSLTLRGIALPNPLKDAAFALVEDAPSRPAETQ